MSHSECLKQHSKNESAGSGASLPGFGVSPKNSFSPFSSPSQAAGREKKKWRGHPPTPAKGLQLLATRLRSGSNRGRTDVRTIRDDLCLIVPWHFLKMVVLHSTQCFSSLRSQSHSLCLLPHLPLMLLSNACRYANTPRSAPASSLLFQAR
jgi:hypothetical protein